MAEGVTPGEALCECGHSVGWHRYNYTCEEFEGCQVCVGCPSIERFFVKGEHDKGCTEFSRLPDVGSGFCYFLGGGREKGGERGEVEDCTDFVGHGEGGFEGVESGRGAGCASGSVVFAEPLGSGGRIGGICSMAFGAAIGFGSGSQ